MYYNYNIRFSKILGYTVQGFGPVSRSSVICILCAVLYIMYLYAYFDILITSIYTCIKISKVYGNGE